ncbi:MAG: hypothetical protein J0L87_14930 [Bacteroidetes bacterium]|nr:hypothetical protein [Bacteroidota bacterium]
MKRILLFTCLSFLLSTSFSSAQTALSLNTTNTYYIYLDNVTPQNLTQATDLLTRITLAKSVDYNSTDSVFVIITESQLDKNKIEGKVQKNFFPLRKMIKLEDIADSMPKMVITGNPEQDETNYQLEKAKWINNNPEAYKLLIQNAQPK